LGEIVGEVYKNQNQKEPKTVRASQEPPEFTKE
jgi:hypothetical protein